MTVDRPVRLDVAFSDRVIPWALECAAQDEFWAACPNWVDDVGRRRLGAELVVWGEHAVVVLPQVKAAVAEQVDGTVSLLELATDLQAVTRLDDEASKLLVAVTAVQLAAIGGIEGVAIGVPPVADDATSTATEPTSDDDASAESPNPVVLKVLPDGRRVISATVTVGGPDSVGAGPTMAAQHLAGDRSLAELIPPDSCVGAKLRNFSHIELISVRCDDGRIRSVRCHDPLIAGELRRAAGDRLVPGETGPIELFVTTPLEGSGPPRIYDGRAERRGRPRTCDDAVRIADEVLGEVTTRHATPHMGGRLQLRYKLLTREDRAVLVPTGADRSARDGRALRSAGWESSVGRAELHSDGTVSAPAAMTTPRRFDSSQVLVLCPGAADREFSQVFMDIVELDPATPADQRRGLLQRYADFVEECRIVDLDTAWSSLLS